MDNLVREFSIALIAAIIGGLIGARVDRRLAAVSAWYRTSTAASRAKREHIVGILAENPHLLAVAYLDALVGVVFMAVAIVIFVQIRDMIDATPLAGGVAVSPSSMSRPWSATLLLVTLAVVLIFVSYFVSRRISIAQEAWRTLGQSNGLPKFW